MTGMAGMAGPTGLSERIVVLVNPRAGGGRARSLWESVRKQVPRLARLDRIERLDLAGRTGSAGRLAHGGVILEERPQQAEDVLVAALEWGIDRLVVVGGDGSFSLAADVVAVAGAGSRVTLGLVPAGTGSDLARSLGLPRKPSDCLVRALDGPPRPLDAFELAFDDGRRRFAVNEISGGVSGEVVRRIDALTSRGRTAYLAESLKALVRYRPASCRVEADGEPWHDGPILLFAVANGTSFGRGMRIAPRAELDDGLADLVLASRVPGWEVPLLLPRLYAGRHLSSRHVLYRRARTVRIEPGEGFPDLDLDGDPCPAGAVTVSVRPGALRVAGPRPEAEPSPSTTADD